MDSRALETLGDVLEVSLREKRCCTNAALGCIQFGKETALFFLLTINKFSFIEKKKTH